MSNRLRVLITIFALAAVAVPVSAGTVQLRNGDRITGDLVGVRGGAVIVSSPWGGEIRVRLESVSTMSAEEPLWILAGGERMQGTLLPAAPGRVRILGDAGSREIAIASLSGISPDAPTFLLDGLDAEIEVLGAEAEATPWSGQVELGAHFSSGNTDRRGVHLGFLAVREVETDRFEVKGRAVYNEEDGSRTTNEQTLSVREDLKFDGWYAFVLLGLERDEFEDLDLRAVFGPGIGIVLADGDDLKAKVEAGPTVVYENYRSDRDDQWDLVARIGFNAEMKVFDNAKITESLELFPSLSDLGEFRLVSETTFEQPLSEVLFFKLGVINEYNTDVTKGVDRWDLKLLASLVYKF